MPPLLADSAAHASPAGEVRRSGDIHVDRFVPEASANDNSEGLAFVIETAETAAGIIVRQADGYRFFAADGQFSLLDGSIFKSPKAAQKAADLMHRAALLDRDNARRFGGGWRDADGRAAPGKARA